MRQDNWKILSHNLQNRQMNKKPLFSNNPKHLSTGSRVLLIFARLSLGISGIFLLHFLRQVLYFEFLHLHDDPFLINFHVWREVRTKAQFLLNGSPVVVTPLSPIVLSWYLCRKSVGHLFVDQFLDSVFFLDLCVYIYTNTTLSCSCRGGLEMSNVDESI